MIKFNSMATEEELSKMNDMQIIERNDGSLRVIMTATPYVVNLFKYHPLFLETEMLQGSKEELPDKYTKWNFIVTDPEKVKITKEFCIRVGTFEYSKHLN